MQSVEILTIDDYSQYILDWIENHFDAQPCLDVLAGELGYSIRMIQHHFQKTHGVTIGTYIHHRRLYRACTLLRMTNLPVGEIACMLHYDNHNNFCRAFKKKLHCTPLTFRTLPRHLLPSLRLPQLHYKEDFTYQIMTLNNETLHGVCFRYEEKFREPGAVGDQIRLQRLQSWFRDSQAPVTIASDTIHNSNTLSARNGLITVDAIIGRTISSHKSTISTTCSHYTIDGQYLCVPFYGHLSEYAKHNIDIYSHLLPTLNLRRREGREIEFFYFTHHLFDADPKVLCEHCIPIINNNET